jgi:23S rRNA (uracil1939-C5)-methyltransferase
MAPRIPEPVTFADMNEWRRGDVLQNVVIDEAVSEGMGLARVDGFVVFVAGGVPGDVADVTIRNRKKKFAEAGILRIDTPSPDRVTPFCSHFGTCGGCKWQHLSYPAQLAFKQKQVTDAFTRLGKVGTGTVLRILPSEQTTHYRNRLDFTFSDQRWRTPEEMASGSGEGLPGLGFHLPQRFDKVLDIETCYLQDDFSNVVRNTIRDFAIGNHYPFFNLRRQEGLLRNLTLRSSSTGEWMLILVFHHDDTGRIRQLMEAVCARFPTLTSVLYVINPKRNETLHDLEIRTWKGRDYIVEEMEGLKFKISAKSFFQTNSAQALRLYTVVREFSGFNGTENVYDLYTGTGTIANFVSRHCRRVTGVDYVPDAIEDARENARRNNIENTVFYAGDIRATLTPEFVRENGLPDLLITDPPRAGMHEDVTRSIADMAPERIVYVSCNAATQARDIALLADRYATEKIQPVDMFPHTSHVENVALLRKRNP